VESGDSSPSEYICDRCELSLAVKKRATRKMLAMMNAPKAMNTIQSGSTGRVFNDQTQKVVEVQTSNVGSEIPLNATIHPLRSPM